MRIPLTHYGLPQVAVFPAALLAAMGLVWWLGFGRWADELVIGVEVALLVVLAWALCFFRDPERAVPDDPNALLAPADGRVTDIERLETYPGFDGPVWRIGIFLNIFNVHINRSPCAARVEQITYRPGRFENAMRPSSGQVNEANELRLRRLVEPQDPIVVRQVSGAVARRIVCAVREGDELAGGQRFGMIKFGSRTELVVPCRDEVACVVQVGQGVKAGLNVLVRYQVGAGASGGGDQDENDDPEAR